ncbi:ester cyclase [Pseudomonas sp. BCA14]|uniref:ester cyclase n=1 Tax=unclassified Pseudomonas TaxID=196821 RepID=UPI00106DD818|nr:MULTISPECIES: ester cyclase [unclassified Pseudomonas]TFF14203.1 ester cyclase [Pseudomonas sp. JMN1]TFF15113.1 ester cyclase [Pseudomonas sp. BCA17]TFF31520.1 ester cyclase [Pseudomonas sp. BCA14]TFF32473.1 ester cyclase [Pseudomonas sp. BCA13]
MTQTELADLYHGYIDCLNRQDWAHLGDFVHADVTYNATLVGLAGYRAMLERDFREIPDLVFRIQLLVVDPPTIASRLNFNVSPRGEFLGLPINGKRVVFDENVFYEVIDGKFAHVWSVIDKAAIERQV